MSVHQFTSGAVAPTAIRPASWWRAKASLTADLNTYNRYVTDNSYDHYTLGLGAGGCARMGEATGETAWFDRAFYYFSGIVSLATPQAGGFLGWRSVQDGNRETPLREIYCWRFCPDLLQAVKNLPAYATQHADLKGFLEEHIFRKWWTRNGHREHAVMHIGSHWCKLCLYLAVEGSTPLIRSRALNWLDTMDHVGLSPTWFGKSLYHHMRPHPLDPSAKFWPAYFDERDIATGSDTSHGEALYTYVAAAVRAGYGLWTMADVDGLLRLKDIFWDVAAGKHWAYQIGPGSGTWDGKYSEVGVLGQFSREFQVQLENDEPRVANNTEKWGNFALNAKRLTDSPPAPTRIASDWPFRSDSPWNLPLANSALYADDANIRMGSANINSTTWTTRIRQARPSDPLVVATGGNMGSVSLRVPAGVTSSNGDDGDLDVIAADGHTHWDFYKFVRQDDTHATYQVCRQTAPSDVLTGTGWGDPDTMTWAGTTAAAACFMGGVMRAWELNGSGRDRIRHALSLSVSRKQLRQAATKAGTFQWPAISADGSWDQYTGTLMMGALLGIPPSVDIEALGLPNEDCLALAWTLQNFGGYIVNKGGTDDGACILYAETESPEAVVNRMRAGWRLIRNQLRVVTNSARATPAGKTAAGAYPPALYPAPTPIAVALT